MVNTSWGMSVIIELGVILIQSTAKKHRTMLVRLIFVRQATRSNKSIPKIHPTKRKKRGSITLLSFSAVVNDQNVWPYFVSLATNTLWLARLYAAVRPTKGLRVARNRARVGFAIQNKQKVGGRAGGAEDQSGTSQCRPTQVMAMRGHR